MALVSYVREEAAIKNSLDVSVSDRNHPPIQIKTKETIAQIATQFQSLDLNNSPMSQEQIFLCNSAT
nr:unnamed protein product [Callosobruchus chinensis]